jgi:hypothetical protein
MGSSRKTTVIVGVLFLIATVVLVGEKGHVVITVGHKNKT